MNCKRILFLMVDGFDTPTSINQLIETLICDILDTGIEVHMVAGRKGGTLPDVPDTLIKRDGFTYDIVDRGGAVDKSNFIKRFFNDFIYVLRAKSKWEKVIDSVDCVLVQSTPLGALHVSALRHNAPRLPIVYNMYDIFPDNTRDVVGSVPFAFFSLLQSRLYTTCDRIVVVSDDMKKTLASKGISEEKLSVVPNWYDERSVAEICVADNRFISKYGIDNDKFIVQFAGSFGYVFDYEFVLRLAGSLRDRPDIEFHMIGQGARLEHFKDEVIRLGLSQIRFFPWQPIGEIADVYSACSIGIIPLARDVIRCAYPSKTSLLMACGRPVLYSVEEDSNFSAEIRSKQIGWCVPRGDFELAAKVIRELADCPSLVRDCSSRARHYAIENLGREKNTTKYVEILKEACQS